MVFFMKSRPGMTRKWYQTAWHHFLSIHLIFGTCVSVKDEKLKNLYEKRESSMDVCALIPPNSMPNLDRLKCPMLGPISSINVLNG